MKIHWDYIKIIAVLVLVVFLYAFTNRRNDSRVLTNKIDIAFIGDNNLFISREAVNKLLIQNNESVTNMAKEKLVLSALEHTLNANKMIQNADVYVTIDGRLNVKIKQKTPIARVSGASSFYIDIEGEAMPLSPVFSARVPLVTGTVNKEKLTDAYALAMYIYKDEFLKKNVIGIHQSGNSFDMRFRIEDFIVKVGAVNNLDTKFNNLKAFYQKASKDNTLSAYSTVNLEFKNQIVCTKKASYGK